MKLYNCPYKGDMCFLYGNCEECAFHKAMEKNRGYRKTIKNLKFSCEQKDLEIKYLEMDKKQAVKDTARDIIAEAKRWVKEHHKDKVTDSFGEREMLFMEAFGCLVSYLMEKYVEGKENGRID